MQKYVIFRYDARASRKLQGGLFDLEQLEEDIAEAENQMSAPGFWDDSEKAQALINRNNTLKETYDQFQAIAGETDELNLMWEMQQEEFDSDFKKSWKNA